MSLSDISPKSSPVYGSFNYLRFIFTVSTFCHRKTILACCITRSSFSQNLMGIVNSSNDVKYNFVKLRLIEIRTEIPLSSQCPFHRSNFWKHTVSNYSRELLEDPGGLGLPGFLYPLHHLWFHGDPAGLWTLEVPIFLGVPVYLWGLGFPPFLRRPCPLVVP